MAYLELLSNHRPGRRQNCPLSQDVLSSTGEPGYYMLEEAYQTGFTVELIHAIARARTPVEKGKLHRENSPATCLLTSPRLVERDLYSNTRETFPFIRAPGILFFTQFHVSETFAKRFHAITVFKVLQPLRHSPRNGIHRHYFIIFRRTARHSVRVTFAYARLARQSLKHIHEEQYRVSRVRADIENSC